MNIASQEVKDKINPIINDLPEDAKKPIVQKIDLKQFPVVDVVLSGKLDSRELYEIADKTLKDRFSQIRGVANVQITGGQVREIRIQMDNRMVYENTISLPQMSAILQAHNMDIPGGYFQIGDQEYTVRLRGEFDNVDAVKELEIPTSFGPKKIRQFADVIDGGIDVRQRATFFNVPKNLKDENVIHLGIVKSTEGNIVEVADAVNESLEEIKKTLPEGCKLEVVNDASEFVRSSFEDTMSNIYLGVLFLVSFCFSFCTIGAQ